jgi:rhamnogalacturonan endolyase
MTMRFNLASGQRAAYTLRAGITAGFAGGRPGVKVNQWTAPTQAASIQPTSRTLTVGNYRGNNTTFGFQVPARALVVGTNVVTLSVVSGSSGTAWLSPGVSCDAVDFVRAP